MEGGNDKENEPDKKEGESEEKHDDEKNEEEEKEEEDREDEDDEAEQGGGGGKKGVKIRMMAATLAPTSPAREVVMMREVHEIRGGVGAVATMRCR